MLQDKEKRRNPEGFTQEEQQAFLRQSYLREWDGLEFERAMLEDGPIELRTKTRTFEEKTFFPYAPGCYSYRRTVLKEYHVTYTEGKLAGKVEHYANQEKHYFHGQVHKNGSETFYPVPTDFCDD